MKRFTFLTCLVVASALSQAQHIVFSGAALGENFDTLSNSGTTNTWTNGSSPLVGWYLETITGSQEGNYRADNGALNSGGLYSYGAVGSGERALGALGSGTPQAVIFGFRVRNMPANRTRSAMTLNWLPPSIMPKEINSGSCTSTVRLVIFCKAIRT